MCALKRERDCVRNERDREVRKRTSKYLPKNGPTTATKRVI